MKRKSARILHNTAKQVILIVVDRTDEKGREMYVQSVQKYFFFHCQIYKFVTFLSSLPWLLNSVFWEFKIYDATAATTSQMLQI